MEKKKIFQLFVSSEKYNSQSCMPAYATVFHLVSLDTRALMSKMRKTARNNLLNFNVQQGTIQPKFKSKCKNYANCWRNFNEGQIETGTGFFFLFLHVKQVFCIKQLYILSIWQSLSLYIISYHLLLRVILNTAQSILIFEKLILEAY